MIRLLFCFFLGGGWGWDVDEDVDGSAWSLLNGVEGGTGVQYFFCIVFTAKLAF